MPEKTFFGNFFGFLGQKKKFSPSFLKNFSGSLKFSLALFRIFSRVDFFFLGRIVLAGVKIFSGLINCLFC